MPNNRIQSLTVNGVTYDIVDNTSGYINAQYIENKTDYSIPVSRVGEIVVGETAIGTNSTNFPTSKAVVDYVDERVVQEMAAIDVGVTGIKLANGTSLSVVDGVVNIPIIGPNQSVGLMTEGYMTGIYEDINIVSDSIPTSTSQLTNDSGFITSETDPTVPAWAKASTKPTYTASEVGALSSSTVIPSKTSDLTNDSGYLTASDIASVMTYKGTKANYASLPSSGNTTGDVWHLTDTGAEWAWDGSAWQELGTAIDLSNYATKATTLAGYGITDAKIQNGTITLGSNTITPLTSYTETDPTVPSWAKASSKPSYGLTEISGTDDLRAIEALTGTSGLLKKTAANTWTLDTNTYLTSYTETDPTVPSWAKQSSKPTYTAAEVGALPDNTVIPSKVSDLTNDSGFITSYTDEKLKVAGITSTTNTTYYPIVSTSTNDAETKLRSENLKFTIYNASLCWLNIGDGGTSAGKLRLYTTTSGGYTTLQSNATTNRTITLPDNTGTVALTSDIPTVPTKVSDLTNDSGFISSYTETDPVFTASAAAGITSTDISNWNAKVSDDKTWNGVTLNNTAYGTYNVYIPYITSTSGTTANLIRTSDTPASGRLAVYNASNYLTSTTPSANDNSTKVATTAYVDAAIPQVYSSTNTGGYLTMATLPIYDGTVV